MNPSAVASPPKTHHGTEQAYTLAIRRLVGGEKLARPAVADHLTANHSALLRAADYGADPQGAGREALRAWLTDQKAGGLWTKGGADETESSSHCAWHFTAWDAMLYFSMRAADGEVVDALIDAVHRPVYALETLCSAPKSEHMRGAPGVVVLGGRCFLGPAPGGDADQRRQRSVRWAWLAGKRPRLPDTLATANDWTHLYILSGIQAAHDRGETWALRWPEILGRIRSGVPANGPMEIMASDLPAVRNSLEIERSAGGVVTRWLSVTGVMRPALWSCVDFRTGAESYGCLPGWAREYSPKAEEIPAPACPGGPGKVWRISAARG